jgi:type VI secretion system protein ImpA
MASESDINLDELLAPVSGDDPAGEPVPFQIKEDLELLRKEVDPADFDEDDPARPTEAKKADWPKIARIGINTLTQSSKDLLVAARTTEALAMQRGFAGLADGFALLRGMVERCWDRMYPVIEDGDLESRAGPFNWLGEADRGARFPTSVRGLPLLRGENGPLAWRDWRAAQEGRGDKHAFDKAVAASSREDCQRTFEDLTRCLTEFNALTAELNQKMGPASPAMTDLRAAVSDCYTLARQILQQKGPAVGETADDETSGGAGGGPAPDSGTDGPVRTIASRSEAYRRLAEAADLLEKLEPHSPIPYLVRKAVELGSLPFPQLMRALIRDESVLNEMNRELGIKESSSE